jgi:hypothetical protein
MRQVAGGVTRSWAGCSRASRAAHPGHPSHLPLLLRLLVVVAVHALAPLAGCLPGFQPILPPVEEDERVDVIALAGPDLFVLEGSRVVLSGRASRGLGGDPILSWSQVEGPPVLLTNPSSTLPAFVAPLAPSLLVFELRASADDAVAVDRIAVHVGSTPTREAGYLVVPPDATATPSSTQRFEVDIVGAAAPPVSLRARASWDAGADVRVTGTSVEVSLPAELPCVVIVDGEDGDGHGLAPAARVFWPEGTPLPGPTRLQAPLLVNPGAAVAINFTRDPGPSLARAWSATGTDDIIPGGVEGDDHAFSAPRRRARLVIAGERRLGGASGGVRYAFTDVTAGSGNIAPIASGGSDRIVQPGARFRIDTSGSFDLDGDPLQVIVTQVLGNAALPDDSIAAAFRAPAAPGELLFHVEVDDGTVRSSPDPVRVLVSAEAVNQPPRLSLPPARYVTPGQAFRVDGSAAEDPDSGFIASITIAQDPSDAVVLLPEPIEAPSVELVAGAAGESYRFSISAFDEDGLGVTAAQEVFVEEAGPYVDPARGGEGGNGTAAAPFSSIAAAIPTALRHALPELLLAGGLHPLLNALPPAVSLRGGLSFADGEYVEGGAPTVVPVGTNGVSLSDARIASLTLRLGAAAGSLRLERVSTLQDVVIADGPQHAAPLLVVAPSAAASLDGVRLQPSGPGAAATLSVGERSTTQMTDTIIEGARGPDAVAVSCSGATLALGGVHIVGGAAATRATALRLEGCTADIVSSVLEGGSATEAVGIEAAGTLLTLDETTRVVGATASASRATAVVVRGRQRPALLRGALIAAAPEVDVEESAGLFIDEGQVSLVSATVEAAAGVAVQLAGGVLTSDDTTFIAATHGVRGSGVDDVDIEGGSIEAAVGLEVEGAGAVGLEGVVIRATAMGVRTSGAQTTVRDSTILVVGAALAVGLDLERGVVEGTVVEVSGGDARGIVFSPGAPAVLTRSSVRAEGTASALAVEHTAPLSFLSSFASARAPLAAALQSGGALTLRHGTLLADDGPALRLLEGGALDAANSALAGAPDLESSLETPWTRGVALAFSNVQAAVSLPAELVTTAERLAALPCDICQLVELSLYIDETGHLLPGPNPLVDAGDPALSLASDIDGEARPQGSAPDIGCDER